MRKLIYGGILNSIFLIGFSIVLTTISIVFFILFFSEVEARIFCVLGFITGIILLLIGIFSFKNIKKVKEKQSNEKI